jgi:hypothetical protein
VAEGFCVFFCGEVFTDDTLIVAILLSWISLETGLILVVAEDNLKTFPLGAFSS